ncbi:protein WHAT'S THIS FACTOR 9, mitochondrial-like [Rutidosis leptorrhynchoides]|uniref:protein WHAT'S THIS FACTOR 9, mitochondrial-like n=1 Tax=Rutidosis leptorrhynchoides TaxID=125765 RepID=UPI003A9A280D
MKYRATISSIQNIFNNTNLSHNHQQYRTITKVRLKWVKNRSLDNIIDIHTDLKAACILKDAIINRPITTQFLTAKSIADTQKLLGITIPTLRFIRRYPTLFEEFPHPKYPSLPCFRLTKIAQNLHKIETKIYENHEQDIIERLCKVLMMSKDHQLPLQSLYPFRWDLGFPYDFDKTLVQKYPDLFRVVKNPNGSSSSLKLVKWVDEYAVSNLQKMNEGKELSYKGFRTGESGLGFPLSFPRGYGAQKKVKSWMDEFQKLPYISPYEDSSNIDPESELMEKRIVGLLHEFLSLTVYKKTKRNYLRNLTNEFNMPFRFTRIFTRYPGIFYLSLKCKTTSVALKEGYKRGKLVNACPIAKYRGKFHHVMRTGLIYRKKGLEMLPELDNLVVDDVIVNDEKEFESEEEEEVTESSGEWVDHEDEDDDEEFDDVSDQD